MEKKFKDIESFLESHAWKHTRRWVEPDHVKEMMTAALEEASVFLEEKLKEKFGHYQEGWKILALATQKDRAAQGYTANDPLLRSGSLKDSIVHMVYNGGKQAVVGSKDWRMVWQEYGTKTTGWGHKGIPPRPVFKITYFNEKVEAVKVYFHSILKSLRFM